MRIVLNDLLSVEREWVPTATDDIETNINEMLSALNCLRFHKDVELFYNSINLQSLIENFENLQTYTNYYLTDPLFKLRTLLLEINSTDWSKSPNQSNQHNYILQIECGFASKSVNQFGIAEAAELKYMNNIVSVLNFSISDFNHAKIMHVIKSRKIDLCEMTLIELEICINNFDTVKYINESRPTRQFNINPKHGENQSSSYYQNGVIVSPLECSKEEAQSILINAVSYKSSNELYGYDLNRQKYLVFKPEGNSNYHGYYPVNQDEVPEDVKSFLIGMIPKQE